MYRWKRWIVALGVLAVLGCKGEGTRIDLTTFDKNGQTRNHYAEFRRASYRLSPGGTLPYGVVLGVAALITARKIELLVWF